MPKTDCSTAKTVNLRKALPGLLLLIALVPLQQAFSADTSTTRESLSGYYTREGNNDSPAQASGNNIYIRFFPQQWVAMMFVPYPYGEQLTPATIHEVFDAARAQTSSSAYLRGTFDLLEEKATLQIERYGYLEDRIIFECGSLAPCTIRFGDGYIELIKPGMITEHIVRYNPVSMD